MSIKYLSLIAVIVCSITTTAWSCPLPDQTVVQLEWAVNTSGQSTTWFEVVGKTTTGDNTPVWSDAIYDEAGRLIWAGDLTCDGSQVLLESDYTGQPTQAQQFESPVALTGTHPASNVWTSSGSTHPLNTYLNDRLGEPAELILLNVTRPETLAAVAVPPLQALRSGSSATASR